MIDQLIIGNKASYDDFEASVAESRIKQPKKKKIKDTVPFSNTTYDFSAINGELYWEERELEYLLEITAQSAESLEEKKTALSDWLMNVTQEELHDPFVEDYHFIATFDDIDFADEEGHDKTTATVIFTAYPYKIADYPTQKTIELEGGALVQEQMLNNSSHRIAPTIVTDQAITLTYNGKTYEISAGTTTSDELLFAKGINAFTLNNANSAPCVVLIKFFEEVL